MFSRLRLGLKGDFAAVIHTDSRIGAPVGAQGDGGRWLGTGWCMGATEGANTQNTFKKLETLQKS